MKIVLCDDQKSVLEELETCLKKFEENSLEKSELVYSAQSGGSELWTRTDMYFCEESLLQWEKRLPMMVFFRCHSKYLVNLVCVTGFKNQVLTLIGGEKIPVSRRRWKTFQLAYMKFDTKNYAL